MTDPDACRQVTVTGEDGEPVTVRVRGSREPWTQETVDAFAEIVRAAQRKYRREHPEDSAVVPNDPTCREEP